jgi:hypothetical protein
LCVGIVTEQVMPECNALRCTVEACPFVTYEEAIFIGLFRIIFR